eukprot:1182578-Prorocentrum_minimum.AAC.5
MIVSRSRADCSVGRSVGHFVRRLVGPLVQRAPAHRAVLGPRVTNVSHPRALRVCGVMIVSRSRAARAVAGCWLIGSCSDRIRIGCGGMGEGRGGMGGGMRVCLTEGGDVPGGTRNSPSRVGVSRRFCPWTRARIGIGGGLVQGLVQGLVGWCLQWGVKVD